MFIYYLQVSASRPLLARPAQGTPNLLQLSHHTASQLQQPRQTTANPQPSRSNPRVTSSRRRSRVNQEATTKVSPLVVVVVVGVTHKVDNHPVAEGDTRVVGVDSMAKTSHKVRIVAALL